MATLIDFKEVDNAQHLKAVISLDITTVRDNKDDLIAEIQTMVKRYSVVDEQGDENN